MARSTGVPVHRADLNDGDVRIAATCHTLTGLDGLHLRWLAGALDGRV